LTIANRIVLGFLGLLLTFSAGAQLQQWWDTGIVLWHRKSNFPIVVQHDLQPVTYDAMVVGFGLGLVAGLCMVWVALGGGFGRKT
jgi:hypothetical protein